MSGHFMRELWWTVWQWTGLFPSTSVLPCQHHLTSAPRLYLSTCFFLPEGQMGEAWEPSR